VTFYLRTGRGLRSLYRYRNNSSPIVPPVANVVWFDSSTNQYLLPPNRTNGQRVTQWENRIDITRHISNVGGVTFRPTYRTNQQNNLSSLYFDSNRLRGQPFLIPVTQTFSLFVVAKFDITSNQQLCESSTDLGFGVSGNRYIYQAGGGYSIGPLADTQWHIHTLIFNSTLVSSQRIKANLDSVPLTLAPVVVPGPANITTASFFSVGETASATLPIKGDIGEIRLYNTALSNQESLVVEQELSNKWGI
jgi:hypothetical protein